MQDTESVVQSDERTVCVCVCVCVCVYVSCFVKDLSHTLP